MAGEGSRGCTKTMQLMQIHIRQDRLPGLTVWDECRPTTALPVATLDPLQKVCAYLLVAAGRPVGSFRGT